jgi:hypothetical protein
VGGAFQGVIAHERVPYGRDPRRLTCRLRGRLAQPVQWGQDCSTERRGVTKQVAAVQIVLQGISERPKLILATIFHDRRWLAET